jgi:hypothetical protein
MRALVVYESMFGNTEAVARAIAAGLAEQLEVELRAVSHAPTTLTEAVDLLVAGGPTHALSMSRPSTREQAFEQGATRDEPNTGLREWLTGLGEGAPVQAVAVFDTRVARARLLPGSAAKKAAKMVRALGYVAAGRKSFWVENSQGPLLPGEVEQATGWGRELARDVAARAPGASAPH